MIVCRNCRGPRLIPRPQHAASGMKRHLPGDDADQQAQNQPDRNHSQSISEKNARPPHALKVRRTQGSRSQPRPSKAPGAPYLDFEMWEGRDHKPKGFGTEHGFTLTRAKLVRKLSKFVRKIAVCRGFGPFQTR